MASVKRVIAAPKPPYNGIRASARRFQFLQFTILQTWKRFCTSHTWLPREQHDSAWVVDTRDNTWCTSWTYIVCEAKVKKITWTSLTCGAQCKSELERISKRTHARGNLQQRCNLHYDTGSPRKNCNAVKRSVVVRKKLVTKKRCANYSRDKSSIQQTSLCDSSIAAASKDKKQRESLSP